MKHFGGAQGAYDRKERLLYLLPPLPLKFWKTQQFERLLAYRASRQPPRQHLATNEVIEQQ
jgi:hypothetical protein